MLMEGANMEINIKELVHSSFAAAKEKAKEIGEKQRRLLHSKRSQVWVESLADHFREAFAMHEDNSVRVFSKYNKSNRHDFGLNELLYDVTVARVGRVKSPHNHELLYVKEALWEVESEFSHDSRQALTDFNKLVLGSATSKLFIGSQDISDLRSFMDVLVQPASACSGDVYAVFLPHPKLWDANQAEPEVFRFTTGNWEKI
jgi:hypothetical protein